MLIPGNFGGEPEAGLLSPYPAPRWADLVQMGNWQELGIVDRERAAQMDERDVIAWVTSCREESAAARAQLEPYWVYYEDLYNLRTWDDTKEEWQSQIIVPEIRTKVRVALSMIQGGLLDAPEFFRVINESRAFDDEYVRFIQRWLKVVVDQSGLVEAYLSALEQGLLLGAGCAVNEVEDFVCRRPYVETPSQQEMQQWFMQAQMAFMQGMEPPPQPQPFVTATPETRTRFRWKMKDVWDMYPDPLAATFDACKYVIEESEADEDEIRDKVMAGVYDSAADIGEPQKRRRQFQNNRYRRFEMTDARKTTRRRHTLTKFVGNICDREGRLVAQNMVVHIANDRAVLTLGPNPRWSGKTGYIWSTPLPYRGRVWGRSLVDADAHVQVAVTSFLNLALDDLQYVVLGAFNWNSSASAEPNVPDSIEPGKIYPSTTGDDVLKKIQFNTSSNQMWPMIRELFDIGGKATQIGEWADGTPTSRGRPSAAEVRTKTSMGAAYVHNVMRNLERNDLEPALELALEDVIQFGTDTAEPRLGAILEEWGGPQAFADPMFRLQFLDRSFRIKVGAISLMMNRDSILERLTQFMQVVGPLGMLPPQTAMEIPYIALSALGFSPEMLRYPANPEQFMQMLMPGAPPGVGPQPQPVAPAGPAQAPGGAPVPMNQMQRPAA